MAGKGHTVDEDEDAVPKAPSLFSERWNLAALAFFGTLFVYVVRVNLSVAIICMVRVPRNNLTLTSNQQNFSNFSVMNRDVTNENDLITRSYVTFPNDSTYTGDSDVLNSVTSWSVNGHGRQSSDEKDGGKAEMSDVQDEEDDMCGDESLESVTALHYKGEFGWDKKTRSELLAMYFYGYIFTQIPGGWLAGRYGGKRVWGICQAVSALCTIFTPLAARAHVYLAYALRFVLGLAAGVSFPCTHAMLGRWAPKLERSKLVAFAFAGAPIGTILTFSLSGLLCVYGFDNGWGSIFYLAGTGNCLWVLVWWWVTADTPVKHKRIKPRERDYILHSIGEKPDAKAKIPTPWKAMFTSGPVWAAISSHMCNNYTNYTLLTSLPTFMKEVLKFDIKQNGALSAIPYICQAVVSIAAGQVADTLREKRILNTKNTRKLMQVTSFLGTAVCIASAGYMTCDQRPLAVFLLCLCLCFMGLNRGGYAVNHIDLAPRHAGVLFGITNTAATIPGMVAPLVAGALTPNRTAEEWRHVFFVCAAMATLGAILFAILADGELQPWALPPSFEMVVQVSSDNSHGNGQANLDPKEASPEERATTPDSTSGTNNIEEWRQAKEENDGV